MLDRPRARRRRALSPRQRRRVEAHLPLVNHTLNDLRKTTPHFARGRRGDVFQEATLALIEAVRSHQPARHGEFAAYAMARIHFAVRRFCMETRETIRTPLSALRRARRRRRADPSDPDSAERLPRVAHGAKHDPFARAARPSRRDRGELAEPAEPTWTIGELIRQRYDKAMKETIAEMLRRDESRENETRRDVINACRRTRWSVPEPSERASLREVATETGCSLGRVTRCEALFYRLLGEALLLDRTYKRLRAAARRLAGGWEHRLTAKEIAELVRDRRAAATGDQHRDQRSEPRP